eukprot:g4101.t1
MKLLWLLWLPVVCSGGGWFGPHEFHESKDELDLTLRVNQKHLSAQKDLETRHHVKWKLKGGLKHAKAGEVAAFRDMLDKLDSMQTDGKVAKQRVSGGTGAADTQSIGAQIKAAVASADYDLAAKLKEQRDKAKATPTGAIDTQSINAQIKAAVASADYDLAAKLKEQRDKAKATPTGAIDTQSINAQIKAAVASADYDLAAKLKEQRDKAKATPTGAIDTQSINAQIKAAVASADYDLAAKLKEQRDKAMATPTGADKLNSEHTHLSALEDLETPHRVHEWSTTQPIIAIVVSLEMVEVTNNFLCTLSPFVKPTNRVRVVELETGVCERLALNVLPPGTVVCDTHGTTQVTAKDVDTVMHRAVKHQGKSYLTNTHKKILRHLKRAPDHTDQGAINRVIHPMIHVGYYGMS